MRFLKVSSVLAVIVVSLLLHVGPAWADVTGQFNVNATMVPQTDASELSKLSFDLVTRLNLDVTLSGVTGTLDFATGLAGMEHIVASASTTLGSVDLRNDIAFAMPFASVSIAGETLIAPIGDELLFVTERLTARANVFGITLTNRLIYEDLNFQHPFATIALQQVSGNKTPVKENLDFFLPSYSRQSQSFAFGDIITLQGRLEGGAVLTLETGFSADPGKSKSMKRRSFSGAAVKQAGSLQFVTEMISVRNLTIGPIDLNATLRIDKNSGTTGWQPSIRSSLRLPLDPLGPLRVSLSSTTGSGFPIELNSASLTMRGMPLTVRLGFDSTIELTNASFSSTFNLSPQASVAFQANISTTSGIDTFSFNLAWSDPSGVLFTGGVSAGQGEPSVMSASVRAPVTSNIQVQSQVRVTPDADTTVLSLDTSYSF